MSLGDSFFTDAFSPFPLDFGVVLMSGFLSVLEKMLADEKSGEGEGGRGGDEFCSILGYWPDQWFPLICLGVAGMIQD